MKLDPKKIYNSVKNGKIYDEKIHCLMVLNIIGNGGTVAEFCIEASKTASVTSQSPPLEIKEKGKSFALAFPHRAVWFLDRLKGIEHDGFFLVRSTLPSTDLKWSQYLKRQKPKGQGEIGKAFFEKERWQTVFFSQIEYGKPQVLQKKDHCPRKKSHPLWKSRN